MFLPRRRDPEPGSIELPAFLYRWVTDGQEDTFDLADPGVVFAFAGEDAALFPRGTYERDEGGPKIVLTDAGQGVRVRAGASDGTLQVRVSIERPRLNRWLEVERERGTMTLRPGERMRKLWR